MQVNVHQTNSDVQMDSASQLPHDAMVCPIAMMEVMKLAAVSYLHVSSYLKAIEVISQQM